MTTTAQPGIDPTDAPLPQAIRPHRRSLLGHLNAAAKYALLLIGVIALFVGAELVIHSASAAPRDIAMIVDRELTLNVLAPGERIVGRVAVTRRAPTDYFRVTHGLLVLTDRRLFSLGVRPRDMVAPSDAPPTFDQHDFAYDSSLVITAGKFLGFMKGVTVRSGGQTTRLAVPSADWPSAQRLAASMTQRRQLAVSTGVRQESLLKVANAQWKAAVAAWQQTQYYVVHKGDALGNVAARWNTTAEVLKRLNSLPDNNIRIGQRLKVRDAL